MGHASYSACWGGWMMRNIANSFVKKQMLMKNSVDNSLFSGLNARKEAYIIGFPFWV